MVHRPAALDRKSDVNDGAAPSAWPRASRTESLARSKALACARLTLSVVGEVEAAISTPVAPKNINTNSSKKTDIFIELLSR
jgi:hypothetical protein